jgi:hypothetical protein
MLSEGDLNAAVGEGIISTDQARRLLAFAGQPVAGVYDQLDPRDEPFRLLRGFRDVFIAIGVLIFGIGATVMVLQYTSGSMQLVQFAGSKNNLAAAAGWFFVLTLVALLLAEWLTRQQRLPLSSLFLTLLFSFWSGMLISAALMYGLLPWLEGDGERIEQAAALLFPAGAFLALVGFYWRYRLPFAMLPIAGALVGLMLAIVWSIDGDWFGDHSRIIVGVLGVLVFAAALAFDMKDPMRVTRFSECGFWLHLLAAPLMVHAVLAGQTATATAILVLFSALVCIALLIDRRALLVSALSYMAIAIYNLIQDSGLPDDYQFGLTALLLGLMILLLGVGWTAIRRRLVGVLPLPALINRLPPAMPANLSAG